MGWDEVEYGWMEWDGVAWRGVKLGGLGWVGVQWSEEVCDYVGAPNPVISL